MNKPSPVWLLETDRISPFAYADNVFTPEECERFIEYGKNIGVETAATGSKESPIVNKSFRDSNIVFISPDAFTEYYYRKLTDVALQLNEMYFGFDLFSFGEGLQFTEYKEPGGKYDFHVDRAYGIPTRKLSLVVQLSDPEEYEGGDLEMLVDWDRPIKLKRNRGAVLAFPSFIMHRVTPVTKGTRHSLVGWINGNSFK